MTMTKAEQEKFDRNFKRIEETVKPTLQYVDKCLQTATERMLFRLILREMEACGMYDEKGEFKHQMFILAAPIKSALTWLFGKMEYLDVADDDLFEMLYADQSFMNVMDLALRWTNGKSIARDDYAGGLHHFFAGWGTLLSQEEKPRLLLELCPCEHMNWDGLLKEIHAEMESTAKQKKCKLVYPEL